MALMEFLSQNLVNTTTQMTAPSSNTGTAAYIFDRNTGLGFTSVNYGSGTTMALGFTFANPVNVSHILIQNHNLKGFRLYYNSVTANSLGVFTGNSASSTYISFATTAVNSIDLQMDSTTVNGDEKKVGEIVFCERRLVFERNPSVSDWRPTVKRKQIVHDMPDGGAKVYNIRDKFQADMSWNFVTTSFKDSLLAEYTRALPDYFVPFPTATSWSGEACEVAWVGDFDFKHGANDKTSGFSGGMRLRQTAGG